MKNHRHPWNLRQIFGSQPVGCVAGSPRPEARIAARVIPAESSRWTFRGPSDADLATWRLGDLATWSWTSIGVPAHTFSVDRSSGVSSILNTKAGDIATSRPSRPRQPSQGPAIVRTSPTVSPLGAILLSLLLTGNSEEPRTFGVSSFSAIFNI